MGNDSSTQKHAALWLLARNGDAAELRMAIARVPPELKCSYLEFEQENATPLTIAVKRGHVECVGVLLSADVDVNHIGIDGLSALHIAVKKNDPAIVRLLVENDAVDCNVVDPHGCTPLFLAAIEGHVQVLDLLLHCGAVDVFARELQTHKDLLTLARIAYSQAGAQNQPRFQVCLDLITKVHCSAVCIPTTLADWSTAIAPASGQPMRISVGIYRREAQYWLAMDQAVCLYCSLQNGEERDLLRTL